MNDIMWLTSQLILELWIHHVLKRDGSHFALTLRQFQWSDQAYKLTDDDCLVCCY